MVSRYDRDDDKPKSAAALKSYWGGTHNAPPNYDGTIIITRIPLDRDGYTSQGRYFGAGEPLYQAEDLSIVEGHGERQGWNIDFFFRAASRKKACDEVRAMYPNAKCELE